MMQLFSLVNWLTTLCRITLSLRKAISRYFQVIIVTGDINVVCIIIIFFNLFVYKSDCGYHKCHLQGYRTLDELRTSGELNRQQLIGLAHYDEFLERMPREEAAEIEQTVHIPIAM